MLGHKDPWGRVRRDAFSLWQDNYGDILLKVTIRISVFVRWFTMSRYPLILQQSIQCSFKLNWAEKYQSVFSDSSAADGGGRSTKRRPGHLRSTLASASNQLYDLEKKKISSLAISAYAIKWGGGFKWSVMSACYFSTLPTISHQHCPVK